MTAKVQTHDPKRIRRIMLVDLTIGVSLTILFALSVFALINMRTFQLSGDLVARVETTDKVVALTFDDGPLPRKTEAILEVLRRNDVPATFYLIGLEAQKNPAQIQAIIDEGHELGNHSYNHRQMVFKPADFIKRDIELTDELFRSHGYNELTTFRPPYGDKLIGLPRYLSANNRTTIMWDVAPDEDGSASSIKDYVLSQARPGSIILLHPMYDHREASLQAIEPIIVGLKAQGYRFVTISELLRYRD